MKTLSFLGVCCILLATTINSALGNLVIFSDSVSQRIELGSHIMILEDPSSTFSLKDVLSSPDFKLSTQMIPNLGVSSSSFWIKFEIKNLSNSNELLLELAQPTLDEIEFYNFLPNGKYFIEKAGESLPFKEREYNHQNFLFKINIPKNETYTYFMRVKSGEEIQIPLALGTPKAIFESIFIRDLISGIYFGIILVMIFYNLFIYLAVRDKSYLYYVVYIFFVGLVQACLQGYSYNYFWPNFPWIATQSVLIVPALSGFAAVGFLRNFLQTKKFTPSLDKGLFVFVFIYIVCITLSFLEFYTVSFQILQVNSLLISLYILFIGYKISKQGYRPAIFFLLGWSMFLGGVFIFVLKNVGVLPYNTFTYYSLQIGSALEVMLLSFALADRINILKKEKEQSQQESLQALRENEKIIKERNIFLDQKVKERTVELEKSNVDLNIAMNGLKETQSQLVNAEKMASLGQLTAGVAHEMNNPINFVSSSIKPLKRDITDIFTLLSKYEELSHQDFKEKTKEINELKKELDIDYLKEEIQTLLKGIDEGASRTAEIVKGLRNFSRLDELDLKKVDINEGLESTLILLNSMMMDKIKVVKEYGNLPKVECYAGKLNQAFMNILNNAIYAIHKANLSEEGNITIKTWEEDLNVMIFIKDNGIGMSPEVKNKIFEPFFTTKDVGEGTGLGMSIVYNIIQNHKGIISVESELGKGTQFVITLPKFQK